MIIIKKYRINLENKRKFSSSVKTTREGPSRLYPEKTLVGQYLNKAEDLKNHESMFIIVLVLF